MWSARLGEYASALSYDGLPEEVVHAAKRSILDWFSAAIPGGVEAPARFVAQALDEETGAGTAQLVPGGTSARPRAAALINGTAAHTLEVDDIYRDAIYHPGPPVIAAALATCQSRKRGGRHLIAATVAGYEVSNRIGRAVQPQHYDYWHTTGTVGTFGAAVGAASALGLNAVQTGHAIANAATFAAALQQAFRSDAMSKALHAGRAAETGLLCALMAERGVSGADNMLEGERGFGNAMSENVDWHATFSDLGKAYTITEMTQKNHCCCGHTFAAIDGVLDICSGNNIPAENIEKIIIDTYAKALEVCANRNPKTAYEAKFSLAYTAALAARQGSSLRLAAFSETLLKDRNLRALMSRVESGIDPRAEAVFPRQRSAFVEIHTKQGEIFHHHAPTRRGDPDAPLSDSELEDKFRELAGVVYGTRKLGMMLQDIWGLEKMKNVNDLMEPGSGS
jgi:2-methylcitrate dehydratase PrpD